MISVLSDAFLLGGSGCGTFYYVWTAFLIKQRQVSARPAPKAARLLPPVSFLRPVKRGVPRLREYVEMLVETALPTDQVIFGVDNDEDFATCDAIRAAHPERDVVVARCVPGEALNPKVNKLIQMSREATHAHWIVSDSEVWMTPEFVDDFREQWVASGADVLTAGYRFINGQTFPQMLDQAAALLTLWPGLAASEQLGPIRFTLGACTGVMEHHLQDAGGWERFSNNLAEDNRLGAVLARSGKKVVLSQPVLGIETRSLSWLQYFMHQRRVAVTYRVSDPSGYFGMLVTHGVSFAALLVLLGPLEPWRWLVFLCVYLIRLFTAWTKSRALNFPLNRFALTVLVASFAETLFWFSSWLPGRVVWGHRSFRVSSDGAIQ